MFITTYTTKSGNSYDIYNYGYGYEAENFPYYYQTVEELTSAIEYFENCAAWVGMTH